MAYDIRTTTLNNIFISGLIDWSTQRFICSMTFDTKAKVRNLNLLNMAQIDLAQVVAFVKSFNAQLSCSDTTEFINSGLADNLKATYSITSNSNSVQFKDAVSALRFANANNTRINTITIEV